MSEVLFDGFELTVEIGFATSGGTGLVPLGGDLADIVWTDVTDKVRSVSISRGRSTELDAFTTGSASVVLDNRDRTFDPEYASGPYFGALTPMRPLRISGAEPLAISQTPLFFGFVDGWAQQYVHPSDATTTVTASDAFKVLNLISLPSLWDNEIRSDAPTHWFKLSEETGSLAVDATNTVTGFSWETVAGAVTTVQSADGLIAGSVEGAASISNDRGLRFRPSLPHPVDPVTGNPGARTLEFWFSTSMSTLGSYGMIKIGNRNYAMGAGLIVDADGIGTLRVWQGVLTTSSILEWSSTIVVNDGAPHHVVIPLYGESASPKVFPHLDGQVMTAGTTRTWESQRTADTIGLPMTQTDGGDLNKKFEGVIDEVIVHPGTFTAAHILKHYQIGSGVLGAGERTDERITRVLDLIEWPADGRNLDAGDSTVQALLAGDATALSLIQQCELAEQGLLFIAPDGRVRFVSRTSLATGSYYTTPFTFTDDGDPTHYGYSNLEFTYDDQLIYNRVIVGRAGGSTFQFDDLVSQGKYFIRSNELTDLIVQEDQLVRSFGQDRLARYNDPKVRVSSISFTPRQGGDFIYDFVLQTDVGRPIIVERTPQGVGSQIVEELRVEGIRMDIGPDRFDVQYSLSPAPPDYFILDSSTQGVLDVNILGF